MGGEVGGHPLEPSQGFRLNWGSSGGSVKAGPSAPATWALNMPGWVLPQGLCICHSLSLECSSHDLGKVSEEDHLKRGSKQAF